ncbi:DUF4830 domain-containing protein [Bacillus dakarensis]|uniref:DUF4830 domain-containing protein n=1 Tax=Robertmurraya dakarensis TaxID=1926278 RepID=UPI0009817C7E|nr:DUF4830 domain-containing protein [Bacillus dakarensis]
MKWRLLFLIAGILLVSGCAQDLKKEHEKYLSHKGWELKDLVEVESYILDIPAEMIRNYEASGVTFLNSYTGEVVSAYTYNLQEKDDNGERLKAVLFEVEEEIIGGYGILPSWTPGIFSLDEKDRLIEEQLVQE